MTYKISAKVSDLIVNATPKVRAQQNIEAIKSLKSANPDINDLELFNGWGSLPGVFAPSQPWEFQANEQLKNLLTTEEFNYAKGSIINAHYTDPSVISAIWQKVRELGFDGGRILDPSMGTGLFFGMMPEFSKKSELFGVELDPIPANISKVLYRRATIYNCGFENANLPDEYFDLVITNVPFGNYQVADPRYDALNLSIHNYFLAKSADLLREGGLLCVITSPFFLDSKSTAFREYLAKKLELVKAVRLPNTAFKAIAGTEVSADILIFQKKTNPTIDLKTLNWINTTKFFYHPSNWVTDNFGSPEELQLNAYWEQELVQRRSDLYYTKRGEEPFYKNPHLLLGTPSTNKLYNSKNLYLLGDRRDLYTAICAVTVPRVYEEIIREQTDKIIVPASLKDVKDGSFCFFENTVYIRDGAYLIPSKISADKIKDFYSLHQLTLDVINAQHYLEDIQLLHLQDLLKSNYDSFVSKYGKINSSDNLAQLSSDPHYYLIRSLEKISKKKFIGLADIFSKRVIKKISLPDKAENIEDALINSLNAKGKLDYLYMAQLLGTSEEEIIKSLIEKEIIFYNPDLKAYEQKDRYLSGNVYKKWQSAISAGLEKNAEELKKRFPLPMLPDVAEDIKFKCLNSLALNWESYSQAEQSRILSKKIDLKLGSVWVPSHYYEDFAREVLGIRKVAIGYLKPPVASWYVDPPTSPDKQEFGTDCLSSAEILSKVLGQQEIKVTIYKDKQVDPIASAFATEEARGKADLIKREFLGWIWKDEARAIDLSTIYNTKINVYRSRKYDGSWLQLPGLNPAIKLRPWQLNAIARIIENPATFLAHDVGLGKSFIMICAIMELRRLGIVHKPVLAALNGTEGQLHDDFLKCYPLANVMIAGKLSNTEDRKLFTSSIKTGDFDCCILTHSQFFELSLSKEYQVQFLAQEKELILEFLEDEANKNPKSISHKMLKSALEKVEDNLIDLEFPELNEMTVISNGSGGKRKLRKKEKEEIRKGKTLDSLNLRILESKRKHNHLDFEGITDCLLIDEVHQMKNLAVFTRLQNIRGIPTNYSQRATDTYTKLLYVLDNLINKSIQSAVNKTGRAIGATGTIFSNTIAEIYNWQRMFQFPVLKELGIDFFDAWVSQFAEVVSSAEISPEGTYRVKTRLKKFSNLSVLHAVMSQFVDIVTFGTIENNPEFGLIRPEPKYIDVIAPASESQLGFLSEALNRAMSIRSGNVHPADDNFLKLTTDLTKAALSMRLMGDKVEAPESKLHDVAYNILQVYKSTSEFKGTQLAFCDFSTPKNSGKTASKIKNLLINNGESKERIRDLKEYIENLLFLNNPQELDEAILRITSKDFLLGQIKSIIEKGRRESYTVYEYVRKLLLALGIPDSEIEFIHNHNGVQKRTRLFEKVNSGQIRILLGSTMKLGTGCNAHKNGIWALHHIDAPWRPSDIEQREGRGIRQLNGENLGKTLKTCLVFRYITERLDALRWQTLHWKQEASKSFLNGADIDSMEDCDEVSLSFAQIKSLATGNPMLIEESNLQSELVSLLIQERSHNQVQMSLKYDIKAWTSRIKETLGFIEGVEADIETTSKYERLSPVDAEEEKETEELKALNDSFVGAFSAILKTSDNSPVIVGSYRGLILYASCFGQNLNYFIKGSAKYGVPFRISDSRHLSMNRNRPILTLDRFIDELPGYLERLIEELETAKQEQERSLNLQGKPFSQVVRLNEVQTRLLEIRELMAKEESVLGVEAKSDEDEGEIGEDNEFWLNEDLSSLNSDFSQSVIEEILSRPIPEYVEEIINPQLEEYRVIKSSQLLKDAASQSRLSEIARIYKSCESHPQYWQESIKALSAPERKIVVKTLAKLGV